MKDMLSNLIQGRIEELVFYIVLIVVFVFSIFIVLLFIKSMVRYDKFKLYTMLFIVVLIMGLTTIPSRIGLTINLINDYNEEIILVKEGTIDKSLTRMKTAAIQMGDEQFLLTKDVETVDEGESCEISYFKYSKYVCDLRILR